MRIVEQYLAQLNIEKRRLHRAAAILTVLSLLVAVGVSWNNKLLIKRVIGIPGDWIEIDVDGTVYLNGEKLDEPYAEKLSVGECDIEFPYQVPQEQYFVLGDMRENSIDSRNTLIGCVAKDQIVGKVFFRIWPFKTIRFF